MQLSVTGVVCLGPVRMYNQNKTFSHSCLVDVTHDASGVTPISVSGDFIPL